MNRDPATAVTVMQASYIVTGASPCKDVRGGQAITPLRILEDAEVFASLLSYCPSLTKQLDGRAVNSLCEYLSAVSKTGGAALPVGVRPSIASQFGLALVLEDQAAIVPDPQAGADGVWLQDVANAVLRCDATGVERAEAQTGAVNPMTLLAGYIAIAIGGTCDGALPLNDSFKARIRISGEAAARSMLGGLEGWLLLYAVTESSSTGDVVASTLLTDFLSHPPTHPEGKRIQALLIAHRRAPQGSGPSLSDVVRYVISLESK